MCVECAAESRMNIPCSACRSSSSDAVSGFSGSSYWGRCGFRDGPGLGVRSLPWCFLVLWVCRIAAVCIRVLWVPDSFGYVVSAGVGVARSLSADSAWEYSQDSMVCEWCGCLWPRVAWFESLAVCVDAVVLMYEVFYVFGL